MRQLFYTNYQSGRSGLSNGIMSIECGVIMAFLTKRFLLLDGNISPPANVVDYDGRVDNSRPSRVTDLLDIPVPWSEPGESALEGLSSEELTSHSLMDSVFYVPGTVDIQSEDAMDFARGRTNWICEDEHLSDVPVLRVSEQPLVPGTDRARHNLSFYSYLFYLDDENRRAVYELLTRMQAQKPYADLASRVAKDLGDFNAVHMRRGDFKVTYGVTVLDRQPWEAVEALEPHFDSDQCLLICTDERDDPFFDEIKGHWPDHLFIDHHILDNYAKDFSDLPRSDSLALAYLSQLVAAQSQDFVGSMTSTFTSMIQRLRGNNGHQELFKFLWNELPEPGEHLERGSHPVSDCVPMEEGVMVAEFEGAYSWNRYTRLINPAWMREWPESFLTKQVLKTGSLTRPATSGIRHNGKLAIASEALIYFEGLRVRIKSTVPGLTDELSSMFFNSGEKAGGSVIAEISIDRRANRFQLASEGETVAQLMEQSEIPRAVFDHLMPLLSRLRSDYSWFDGMVLRKDAKTILVVGDWARHDSGISLAETLCREGWSLLGDEAVPVNSSKSEAIPFARCAGIWGQPGLDQTGANQLDAIVYASLRLHNRSALFSLSPSAGVAELTRACRDFPNNRKESLKRLCSLVEQVSVFQLCFSHAEAAARALEPLAYEQAESD